MRLLLSIIKLPEVAPPRQAAILCRANLAWPAANDYNSYNSHRPTLAGKYNILRKRTIPPRSHPLAAVQAPSLAFKTGMSLLVNHPDRYKPQPHAGHWWARMTGLLLWLFVAAVPVTSVQAQPADDPLITSEEETPRWRAYADGPLQATDFKLDAPASRTEQEAKHEAMIYLDIRVDYRYSTSTGAGKVTLKPEKISVWAAMDLSRSWFSSSAKRPMALLDHEQGHFDLHEVAARKLQRDLDAQLAGAKLKYTARTEQEAVQKFKTQLQKWTTTAAQDAIQASVDYDNLSGHGKVAEQQQELRQLQIRELDRLRAPPAANSRKATP